MGLTERDAYYPSLAIENGFYPKHLGDKFVGVYRYMRDRRNLLKAEGRKGNKKAKLIQEGLKLANNSVFGKSKDKYSFVYYPKMTMQICINGQLSLLLLIEMLYEKLGTDNIKMIQANTDGITYKVRRTHEKLAQEVCDEWTGITKMTLELAVYTKMIIENVNNYISVKETKDGSLDIKQKGVYEEFTKSNINSSWHKDHSAQIVPHALTKYFVDNIPIEKTIRECTDIFMFYIMERSKSGLGIWSIDNTGKRVEQQRITRHYISRSGVTLYKTSEEDSSKYTKCVSGYYSTVANKHVTHTDFSKYNVDYNYYIRECNKRIYVIEQSQKQTSLFD